MATHSEYSLGTSDAEIARLDGQSALIGPATSLLLRSAGIESGMRVLDLGTGLGHVAFELAELVGTGGSVVGIDEAGPLLEVAERRRAAAGVENLEFRQADARTFRADDPFDAVVARLLLFHLPDAAGVLRHHVEALRPGGLALGIDYDIGSARSEPEVPLITAGLDWIGAGFRSAGANPVIGARLGQMLREAGLADVTSFGVQPYLAPDDPQGPFQLAGVVRSLAPQLVAAGIATEAELGLDTLQERLAGHLAAANAVLLPPAVAGAWGRR
jgi:SAM-dependent methyltransferase